MYWDSPEDSSVFPSSFQVEFNASCSWDLDDDPLIWEWTSSIDGIIGNQATFVVNHSLAGQSLSDGVHVITARLCDDNNNCVQQSRTIELSNFDPVVFVDFTPELNSFNELIMPKTGTLSVNLTGTYDPEGDQLNCWISTSYGLTYPEQTGSHGLVTNLLSIHFP